MTQHEGQGEDLIRTATAFVQRIELAIDGFSELLVVGFPGGLSVADEDDLW